MPFTTGNVLARNTGTQGGNPVTVSLTAVGTDARTALGSGNITLVAGGLAPSQQANSGHIDIVSMNFFLPATANLDRCSSGMQTVSPARSRIISSLSAMPRPFRPR